MHAPDQCLVVYLVISLVFVYHSYELDGAAGARSAIFRRYRVGGAVCALERLL